MNDARASRRVLLRQGAPEDVSDDLCFLAWMSRGDCARWQTVLAETLEGPETTGQQARSAAWAKRLPDLLFAALVVVTLLGPAQRDNRSAPLPVC